MTALRDQTPYWMLTDEDLALEPEWVRREYSGDGWDHGGAEVPAESLREAS